MSLKLLREETLGSSQIFLSCVQPWEGKKSSVHVAFYILMNIQSFIKLLWTHQFSSVQSLNHVRLFVTPWTAACQASLSITNSWILPKPMSIESMMASKRLILCRPFSSCPQSFPAEGYFQMSQLFTSGGQSIGVSASTSVLPMNAQESSLLGRTGCISLQSKGLSRVFSNTTVQKHQLFSTQLSS